jgi:molybdopterin converting factor small subunit
MPDLSILNTVIAMVIVILVLSLIVQSLQTLVKKLFKLKSVTIRNSLVDLFETITHNPSGAAADGATPQAPQQLVEDVTKRLKEMGRKTLFGRTMLDSLAKGDLLKVLTRVEVKNLLPGAVDKFQTVLATVGELKKELGEIKTDMLEGDASAKFAALQASVMPLANDIEALASGDNKINPKVLLGDLYRLRQVKATEVLAVLGEIQEKVGGDLEAARATNDEAQAALADARKTNDAAQVTAATTRANESAGQFNGVKAVSEGLKRIAEQITALGHAFDSAFAPLRERLEQAEVWYDTVMQGFEERYARHMRTVAIIISIIVVIVLNANFFSIYQAMKNPVTAQNVQDIYNQSPALKGTQGGTTTTPPANTNANTNTNANANVNANAAPTQTPPANGSTTTADIKNQVQETKGLVDTYKSFGITPLTRQQVSNFFTGKYTAHDVSGTFFGWFIMIMLLSAGAPFWQDTLESLFGLKNLLRQKSDTKNVEGDKGGNPKP